MPSRRRKRHTSLAGALPPDIFDCSILEFLVGCDLLAAGRFLCRHFVSVLLVLLSLKQLHKCVSVYTHDKRYQSKLKAIARKFYFHLRDGAFFPILTFR